MGAGALPSHLIQERAADCLWSHNHIRPARTGPNAYCRAIVPNRTAVQLQTILLHAILLHTKPLHTITEGSANDTRSSEQLRESVAPVQWSVALWPPLALSKWDQ